MDAIKFRELVEVAAEKLKDDTVYEMLKGNSVNLEESVEKATQRRNIYILN